MNLKQLALILMNFVISVSATAAWASSNSLDVAARKVAVVCANSMDERKREDAALKNIDSMKACDCVARNLRKLVEQEGKNEALVRLNYMAKSFKSSNLKYDLDDWMLDFEINCLSKYDYQNPNL